MGCPWMGGGAFDGWPFDVLLHLSIARSQLFHAYGVLASGLRPCGDVRCRACDGGPSFDAPPCCVRDDSLASFAAHLLDYDFHCGAYDVHVDSCEIQSQR